MNEYTSIIIAALGVISAFLVWLQRRTEVRLREQEAKNEVIENRQRTIQNEQIRAQSEANSAAADRLNTQKLIEVIGATNERWQKVVDAMSARKYEEETHMIAVLDKLDTTIDRNSNSVDELADGVAAQFGMVAKEVLLFSSDNKATEHFIRTTIESTNRNIDSVLEAAVAIRDRIIPLIDNLQGEIPKLENCAAMMAILEEIRTIVSAPQKVQPVTQPLPELPHAGDAAPETHVDEPPLDNVA